MSVLALLNGPPAVGKSTLAARYVEANLLSLNLDIDIVRGQLGRWLDQPLAAGLAARRLALAMAEAHLRAGHDVIVPQFVGRPEFIEQLEATAAHCGAAFAEIALMCTREEAVRWFAERSEQPENQQHVDAAQLAFQSAESVGGMYDAFRLAIQTRPGTVIVPVVRSDVDRTFQALEAALHAARRARPRA